MRRFTVPNVLVALVLVSCAVPEEYRAVAPETTAPTTTTTTIVEADHVLCRGHRGPEVEALQAALIAAGYLSIDAPTGYFGDLTEAAVMDLERDHGIVPADGVVDVEEMAVLDALEVDNGFVYVEEGSAG